MKLRRWLCMAALLSAATPAAANVTGTISEMDATAQGNLALRVYFEGNPTFCAGGQPWAYLEPTDTNYQWFAALLLSAYLNHKTVNIGSTLVGSYCQIQYVSVTG